MGYDPSTCNQKLAEANLSPSCEALSNPYHCDDLAQISPVIHQFCGQQQTYYAPVQALVCIRYANNVPVEWKYWTTDTLITNCLQQTPLLNNGNGWTVANCYCCCSCFAYNTPIAVPDGEIAIQELKVGASVRTASRDAAGQLVWDTSDVTLSAGVPGGDHPFMVYINHGDESKDLICNAEQVFLLADGSLIQAAKLTINDQLVDEQGKPVKINVVAVGNYHGGIHHISTGKDWNGSPDGHLLLAAGVVAGDFALQMNYSSTADSRAFESRASIGTAEYSDTHADAQHAEGLIAFTTEGSEVSRTTAVQAGKFRMYAQQTENYVGKGVGMFTQAQATDILENGQQMPLSNPVPKTAISNVFHVMKGFYPEINFYLDWYHMEPNVYSFEEYGQKFVVVTGGLARVVGLGFEGLMMAVADGVSRFVGLPPMTYDGWVGTGAADYFAFGVISRAVWYGNNWLSSAMPAFTQLQAVMKLISAANAGGNPNNPVEFPSIDCRLGAMQSGLAGGALPTCCGGEPPPAISLEAATPICGGVALTLSSAPTGDSVTDLKNYILDPTVTLTEASVDPVKNFIVNLKGEFASGAEYKVTIQNLQNFFGGGVDPKANSATFTAG